MFTVCVFTSCDTESFFELTHDARIGTNRMQVIYGMTYGTYVQTDISSSNSTRLGSLNYQIITG